MGILYVRFEPTDDENIVIGVKEVREKIHLDKLRMQLQELEKRIESLDSENINIPSDLPIEIQRVIEDQKEMIEAEKERLIEEKKRLELLVEELRINGYNI